MTAADHANTVREALAKLRYSNDQPNLGLAWESKEALAALDALQHQAETAEAEKDERVKILERLDAAEAAQFELRAEWKRAEAAEAERDAAVQERDAMLQFVQAEQPPDEVFRALQREHGLPETGSPKHPAERAAEQAHAAYTNVKRDYDDVFGQLLRRHSDVDRAEQAAEQARNALQRIVEMGDYVYKPHEFADIARAALGEKP